MNKPNQAAAFNGPGQVQEPPAPPAQNAAQPAFVTLEQAQEIARQASEDAFRRAQSLMGKTQSGFEQRVQAELQNLTKTLNIQKAAGMQITPEQEAAMRQQVISQSFQSEAQPTQAQPGAPAAQPQGAQEAPPDSVTAEAWRMMDEAQVIIEETDPEYQTVSTNGTPYQFLQSIERAIQTKKARLGQPQPGNQPIQQAPRTPTNAGGSGSPPAQVAGSKSLDTLWAEAQAQGKI